MVFNWFRRQFDEDSKQDEEKAVESEGNPSAAPAQAEDSEASSAPETAASQDLLSWAKAAYVNIQQREGDQAPETTASIPATAEPEVKPTTEDDQSQEESVASDSEQQSEQQIVVGDLSAAVVAEPESDLSTSTPENIPQDESSGINARPELIETDLATNVVNQIERTIDIEGAPRLQSEQLEALEEIGSSNFTYSRTEESERSEEDEVNDLADLNESPSESSETEQQVTEPQVIAVDAPDTASTEAAPVEETEAFVPFWAQSEADRQARIAALAATAIDDTVVEPTVSEPVAQTTSSVVIEDEEPALPFDEGFLWSAEVLAAQGRRPQDISIEEITWLKRLRQGLDKTRLNLVNQLKALVGQGPLSADAIDDIESLLLQADVGVKATDEIISALQTKLRNEVLPPEEAIAFLKQILRNILDAPLKNNQKITSRNLVPTKNQLNIWLITGVNGAGKTTTIGKIAHLAQKSGYSTLIAAADTFRAAAVQQVQVWGDRSQVEVIANPSKNADPAAVVFDAITAAQSRGTELLLVDTAGRLQNKKNLMDELSKIRRIVDKKSAGATVESLLVLDATLGQNGLRQAEVFSQSAGISGVVLTKLDGTAKGGVALAVVQQLNLPIRFIGAGEGIEDLRPFSSYEFVEALLSS